MATEEQDTLADSGPVVDDVERGLLGMDVGGYMIDGELEEPGDRRAIPAGGALGQPCSTRASSAPPRLRGKSRPRDARAPGLGAMPCARCDRPHQDRSCARVQSRAMDEPKRRGRIIVALLVGAVLGVIVGFAVVGYALIHALEH